MSDRQPVPFRDAATAEANRQVFSTSRDLLGTLILVGDILVAIGVPIALRDHGSPILLIGWGTAVCISSYGWELLQRVFPDVARDNETLRDRWGWVATTVWAALPWLLIDSLHIGVVAWILVFVVVFAIGTDMLFLSQSDAPSLDLMVLTYCGSYLAAFGTELQLIPMMAVIVAGVSFSSASSVWAQVANELIEKRVQSDERSRIDGLTGLATRTAAAEAIDALIEAGNDVIHCAFVDIDDFKHLNDNYGYAAGDQALIAVGEVLRREVPESWTVARFGGDEFVASGAVPFDFRTLIDAEIRLADHGSLHITQSLSIGLTAIPAERATAEDLFREAAAALRFAKRLGKHQLMEMTDELRALEDSKVALGARAGAALDSGEITPWAQKIVDLQSHETVGLELLARWQQDDGSMLLPNDFVPVIEDQGRGPTLGLLMIRHAIETLAHPLMRNRSTFLTVNVSARHLYHRRLPAEILTLLGLHSVAPERLVLEITESQHLPSSPIWQETAHQLRTLGTGLAMDDFGTGYSSMEQLLQIPFTHVKVDSLITQALDRPGAAALAGAIAATAEGAGMVSVVEGIETRDQLDAMQSAGYRLGQGYFFHRPEPLAEVIKQFARTPSSAGSLRSSRSPS